MLNRCNCSRIDITPRGNARINIGSGRVASLDVGAGDITSAITQHNLDEKAHPYILRTYATREYAESLAKTFVYEQGIASDEWVIEHNLNKNPAVSVVDSAGNEIIASVQYIDENTVVIKMNGAFKGKAYLN